MMKLTTVALDKGWAASEDGNSATITVSGFKAVGIDPNDPSIGKHLLIVYAVPDPVVAAVPLQPEPPQPAAPEPVQTQPAPAEPTRPKTARKTTARRR